MKEHKIPFTANTHQSTEHSDQPLCLWATYCQKLHSIAGVYSQGYWLTSLSDRQHPHASQQSKTRQALHTLSGPYSKLDLMRKITRNLTQCRRIDQDQERLFRNLIKIKGNWERFAKRIHAEVYLAETIGGVCQGEEEEELKMKRFQVEFDGERLGRFQGEGGEGGEEGEEEKVD